MHRSAAWAFLGGGVLALVVYELVPSLQSEIYTGIGLASLGAVVASVVGARSGNRRGWWLLALTLAVFVAGDTTYYYDDRFPGVADAFYLPGYVVWIAAVAALVRHERLGRDTGSVIDAGIVTVSVSVAVWAVFLDGHLPKMSLSQAAVGWAYVVGDLALLAVMVRATFLPGRRSLSFWALVASIAVMPAADAAYVVPASENAWSYGYWTDLLWLLSYVLIGAAALHPSMCSMTSRFAKADDWYVSVRRLYVLGVAVMMLPAGGLASDLWHGHLDVPVLASASMVVVVAITARFLLITRDLYAAREQALESERRFRMVFERSPIGISVGRDGIMSETNPALQRMLAYTGEELARMHYTEVTHPDDHDLAEQLQLDSGARDAFVVDKRYTAKDGRVVETHVHVALDLDDGLGISLIEDVTERRELEEQLRQSQKMEAVGKLAGGVAHDFNNLMTAVLGYSDLILQRRAPTDADREKIVAIREAAVRASDLTRHLLAFGRRQMLQTVDVDLRDVVRRMEGLLRRVIGEDLRLLTSFGAEPVVVRADETQLEQVIVNLAVNARDAMPNGGTLTIGVVGDGDTAVLSVADTGTGMDEATCARIFEPFFTTKAMGEGSGLGLSTVHGIVGQSGGAIDVASAPGVGTIFTVRLPLRSPAALPEDATLATVLTD